MTRTTKRNIWKKLLELLPWSFDSSRNYWLDRYKQEGDSGNGSYGELAKFKADFINEFVKINGVASILEFGCGDGNQLTLAEYPEYTGVDISPEAIKRCKEIFSEDSTKSFLLDYEYSDQKADLVLSLDVLYHLVEEQVFSDYMQKCFNAAGRFLIIYSSNHANNSPWQKRHVRHHHFSDWIATHRPEWRLIKTHMRKEHLPPAIAASSFADFYVYSK